MKVLKSVFANVIVLCVFVVLMAGCGSKGESSSTGGSSSDTTAPSVPTGLTSTVTSTSQISLSWGASTDAVGVTGYKVYRDGTYMKSLVTTTALDNGLTASTKYCYQVSAYDAAGNECAKSAQSCTITATVTNNAGAYFRMPDSNQTQSYTTTFGEDADYTINPPSYTDNGNGTTTDNITSLVWQKQDNGVQMTWTNAMTYCDNLSFGGQTDWRLPSRMELISIIDSSDPQFSYNPVYFPTNTDRFFLYYWSSTTSASNASDAGLVRFYYGVSAFVSKTDTYYVRCVRGVNCTPEFGQSA